MQNLFQFLMNVLFGNRWTLFDLKRGYRATLFMNELELDLHREKLSSVVEGKSRMEKELAELEARPPLAEEEYLAMLEDDQKDSSKALYDIKKKVDGERAEEITTLKNRLKAMDGEIEQANAELQKGYAITYQNRVKFDFINNYKIKKTYADKN